MALEYPVRYQSVAAESPAVGAVGWRELRSGDNRGIRDGPRSIRSDDPVGARGIACDEAAPGIDSAAGCAPIHANFDGLVVSKPAHGKEGLSSARIQ